MTKSFGLIQPLTGEDIDIQLKNGGLAADSGLAKNNMFWPYI